MFSEFQIENLIGDIQSVDSLNLINYEVYGKQYTFFITTEDSDTFDYVNIIMGIMLKYDLITLAVYDDGNEGIAFETVTFNRFGAN